MKPKYLNSHRASVLRWLFVTLAIVVLLSQLQASSAQAAFNSHLTRYPYLTDLVSSSVIVNFATDQSHTTARVKYGRVGVESCTANTVSATRTSFKVYPSPYDPTTNPAVLEYQWKAKLSLRPGAQYCYRVYLSSNPEIDLLDSDLSPAFKAQAPAGSTQAFKFIVFGDWGMVDSSGANPYQHALMANMATQGALFAITVGDNIYSTAGFANTPDQTGYGDLIQVGPSTSAAFGQGFWKLPGANMGFFPAVGNHGFSSLDLTHPHFLNFPQEQAVALSAGRYELDTYQGINNISPANYPSAWYAFDAGLVRFYILEAAWPNSNVGDFDIYTNDYDYHWQSGAAEYKWLKADLEAHPGGLKFAIFHFPLYSDNSTETSDTLLQGSASLEGLLHANGVQLGFSGHAHIYQRNTLPNQNSLITYVTGGGGATLEPIGPVCSSSDAYGIGWSNPISIGSACGAAQAPRDINQVYHYLLVTVNGTQVTVTPINALGKTFDVATYNFTANKETNQPSVPNPLKLTSSTATTAGLSWGAASDDTDVRGYAVYRNGVLWAVTQPDTQRYQDSNLVPGTTYEYRVDAFDAWGNRSAMTNAITIGRVTQPPSAIYLPLIAQ